MVVCLIIEAIGPGLVSLWFAAGALVAAVFAWCGASVFAQCIAFGVSAALFLILLKPWAMKHIHLKQTHTNADAAIDCECIVTEAINNLEGRGQVSVQGKIWTARSEKDQPIPVGTHVISLRIEGVKLIVKPLNEKEC